MGKNLIEKKIKLSSFKKIKDSKMMSYKDRNVYRLGKIYDKNAKGISFIKNIELYQIKILSDLEFSITGLCNRKCVFCPRANPEVYPNLKEYMSIKLFTKIMRELAQYDYVGRIGLSGYSEPFMHKKLFSLVEIAKKILPKATLEITTNGDMLNSQKIRKLHELKLDAILVSMYDGPKQIKHFEEMIKKSGVGNKFVILRKRYLPEKKNFGINLSNRAGMTSEIIDKGILEKEYLLNHKCFYTHYHLMIDHDGKVRLCSHDWVKKLNFGDLNKQSVLQVWTGKKLTKFRKLLGKGNRKFSPCNNCNVIGTLEGRNQYNLWKRVYK